MKKLIAMMGAVAMAFGLYADGLKNTVGFEDGAYTAGSTIDVTKDDSGAEVSSEEAVWSATDPAETGTVTEYGTDTRYTYGDQPVIVTDGPGSQFLALETQGLFRNITAGGAASSLADGDVFFDTLVKLSATDGLSVPDVGDDAKIAIWAGTDEDNNPGVTNLYVTAAYQPDGENAPVATNYTLNVGSGFDFNAWHRVTVRSLVANTDSFMVAGFVVFVDGVQVACSDNDYADKLGSDLTLATEAGKFATDKQLFVSLMADDVTVTALGFKGTGAADDVSITDAEYAPQFAKGTKVFTLDWDPDAFESITVAGVGIDDLTTGTKDFELTGATTELAVSGVANTGYKLIGLEAGEGCKVSEDGTKFTGIVGAAAGSIVAKMVYFTVNGVECTTLTEAFTEAAKTLGSTITLSADYAKDEAEEQEIENADITLDLAGNKMTFTGLASEDDIFYITTNAKLTILDTVGGGEISIEGEDDIVIAYADGELVIGGTDDKGATFTGKLCDPDTTGLTITGGNFDKENNSNESDDGLAYTIDEESYKVIETKKDDYWTVVKNDTPDEKGTVIFICQKTGLETEPEEVEPGEVTPPAIDTTGIYTAEDWYDDPEFTVKAELTIAAGQTKTFYAKAQIEFDEDIDGNKLINEVLDLQKLQAAVADGETFEGDTFKQTAEITLTDWTGIGTVDSKAFSGVYNGNGQTLNVAYAGKSNYGGFFNYLTNGAVISNLTFEASLGTEPNDGEFGFAAVAGKAVASTIADITVNGTIGTAAKPLSHNAAGVVVRADGGTIIKDCVNNASVFGAYTKMGGFVAIVNGSGTVTFENCVNNGAITAKTIDNEKTAGADGLSGILGYTQANAAIVLNNCENKGTLTGVEGSTIGTIVAKVQNGSVTATGCKAQADVASFGAIVTAGSPVTGLSFATVDAGVATFVADDALAAEGEYKVMAAGAAPVFAFTEAGTIAFNTNMFFVADYTGITAPDLELTSDEDAGIVTFTAKAAQTDPVDPQDLPGDISDEDAAILQAKAAKLIENGVDAAALKAATKAAKAGETLTADQQQIINSLLLQSDELVAADAKVKAASITIADGKVTVTVAGEKCTLPAKTTIGYLTVKHAAEVGGTYKAVQRIEVTTEGVGSAEMTAGDDAGFYKAEFEWNKPAFEAAE